MRINYFFFPLYISRFLLGRQMGGEKIENQSRRTKLTNQRAL